MLRLIGLATILVATPATLSAQQTGNDDALLQCRSIKKKSQRLECFDNAMNAMFCNAKGERRYLVNTDKCPGYADSLEQQPWADNGEPDKKGDLDHPNDAGGYFIHHDYPLIKPASIGPIKFQ